MSATRNQKNIERLIRGEKGLCPHCNHDKARSTCIGAFCMRCKKNIDILPIVPKPMRGKGVHPKAGWKKRRMIKANLLKSKEDKK